MTPSTPLARTPVAAVPAAPSHPASIEVASTPPVAHPAFRQSAVPVQSYLTAARASSTRRAYASSWAHFTAWCAAQPGPDGGRDGKESPVAALPAAPATVAA